MRRTSAGIFEAAWEVALPDETTIEVTAEELRDFLAADLVDDVADPVFKESLRERLWESLRLRYGGRFADS
jgi:hypothetical protein